MATPQPAEAKLSRLLEYQRAIESFARIASEARAPERLMHRLTAVVSRITHVSHVKILRYRPDPGDLLVEGGVGWRPGVVGHAVFSIARHSPPGRALQTGAPVVIEDLPGNPEFVYSDILREHGIVSVINVPVSVEGRTWGVLEIDHNEPRAFDEEDAAFLNTMANIAGMAIARYEVQLAIAETAERHTQEMAAAETMLRELQHRTKNNFQTIVAFLALKRRHASPEVRERLGTVMDRVQAIALAHDQLSLREGGSKVDFSSYLRALCANIDPRREEIEIALDTVPAVLSIDRAVPAGLIVNELVTNALKHAFDEDGGTIRVAFRVEPDQAEAALMVEDDGKGMGPAREGGLGMSLIAAFAQQLNGRVERPPIEAGTLTVVRFPLPV